MKTYKILKSEYKDIPKLYKRIKAAIENIGFPSCVYVNKNTYKEFTKAIKKEYIKQYPYLFRDKLNNSVNMHLFNIGPVILQGNALKDGFILVDEKSIIEEYKHQIESKGK